MKRWIDPRGGSLAGKFDGATQGERIDSYENLVVPCLRFQSPTNLGRSPSMNQALCTNCHGIWSYKVEALAHFLSSLGGRPPGRSYPFQLDL